MNFVQVFQKKILLNINIYKKYIRKLKEFKLIIFINLFLESQLQYGLIFYTKIKSFSASNKHFVNLKKISKEKDRK
jgi:hypothetical protein